MNQNSPTNRVSPPLFLAVSGASLKMPGFFLRSLLGLARLFFKKLFLFH